MSDDVDFDLTPDQWDALRALRNPVLRDRLKTYVIDDLTRLGLVTMNDGAPVMTRSGRKVLVRGSCRLLDLAA